MEGPYFQPETFMRLTYSLVYDCINVWIIIKCGMASFIGLACMRCLHCTCMQLCVHICTLNAALIAECLLNVAWLHLTSSIMFKYYTCPEPLGPCIH